MIYLVIYFLIGLVSFFIASGAAQSHGKDPDGFLVVYLSPQLLFIAVPFWPIILAYLWRTAQPLNYNIDEEDTVVRDRKEDTMAGRVGTVVTELRPSGKIDIDGELHTALSSCEAIETGTQVTVVSSDGLGLKVIRAEQVVDDQSPTRRGVDA
ncbi:MAG: NfeD family protein [Verrucomicrobiota bacterium]